MKPSATPAAASKHSAASSPAERARTASPASRAAVISSRTSGRNPIRERHPRQRPVTHVAARGGQNRPGIACSPQLGQPRRNGEPEGTALANTIARCNGPMARPPRAATAIQSGDTVSVRMSARHARTADRTRGRAARTSRRTPCPRVSRSSPGKIAVVFGMPRAGRSRAAGQPLPFGHDAEHGEKRVQLPVLVILCHGGQSIAITLVSPTHYWGGGALSCCFSAQRRTRPSYAPR